VVLRWTAAGMLNAERSFRRIKGYKQMPQLVDALRRHANPDTDTVNVAAKSSPRIATKIRHDSGHAPGLLARRIGKPSPSGMKSGFPVDSGSTP
jgi:hypothetical protein